MRRPLPPCVAALSCLPHALSALVRPTALSALVRPEGAAPWSATVAGVMRGPPRLQVTAPDPGTTQGPPPPLRSAPLSGQVFPKPTPGVPAAAPTVAFLSRLLSAALPWIHPARSAVAAALASDEGELMDGCRAVCAL